MISGVHVCPQDHAVSKPFFQQPPEIDLPALASGHRSNSQPAIQEMSSHIPLPDIENQHAMQPFAPGNASSVSTSHVLDLFNKANSLDDLSDKPLLDVVPLSDTIACDEPGQRTPVYNGWSIYKKECFDTTPVHGGESKRDWIARVTQKASESWKA